MTFEKIEELAEVLQRTPLTKLEVEAGEWSISLERPGPGPAARPARPVRSEPEAEGSTPDAEAEEGTRIEAPIVGVFHESPIPILLGQAVRVGEALGSIEALALRNDVRAPVDGEITAIHVEEGQPVEYGQALFTISGGE